MVLLADRAGALMERNHSRKTGAKLTQRACRHGFDHAAGGQVDGELGVSLQGPLRSRAHGRLALTAAILACGFAEAARAQSNYHTAAVTRIAVDPANRVLAT